VKRIKDCSGLVTMTDMLVSRAERLYSMSLSHRKLRLHEENITIAAEAFGHSFRLRANALVLSILTGHDDLFKLAHDSGVGKDDPSCVMACVLRNIDPSPLVSGGWVVSEGAVFIAAAKGDFESMRMFTLEHAQVVKRACCESEHVVTCVCAACACALWGVDVMWELLRGTPAEAALCKNCLVMLPIAHDSQVLRRALELIRPRFTPGDILKVMDMRVPPQNFEAALPYVADTELCAGERLLDYLGVKFGPASEYARMAVAHGFKRGRLLRKRGRVEFSETNCCICLEPGVQVRPFACSHLIHAACCSNLLAGKIACPLCRSKPVAAGDANDESPSA